MASTQKSILDEIYTTIAALSLTYCEEVAIRAEPKDGEAFYPGITVSVVPEVEYRGTNERDDIGYGVQITMVVNNDVDPTEEDLFTTWRQTIRRAQIHQKIAAIAGVCTVHWEPGPIYKNTDEHLDIGTFILRVITRETRTGDQDAILLTEDDGFLLEE